SSNTNSLKPLAGYRAFQQAEIAFQRLSNGRQGALWLMGGWSSSAAPATAVSGIDTMAFSSNELNAPAFSAAPAGSLDVGGASFLIAGKRVFSFGGVIGATGGTRIYGGVKAGSIVNGSPWPLAAQATTMVHARTMAAAIHLPPFEYIISGL